MTQTFTYRESLALSGQDYEDAREEIASLIREKAAPGLRVPANDSIRQAYALVIDALYVEWAEGEVLRERLASLLHDTANALKGEPKPLTDHSWADLPDTAANLRALLEDVVRSADEQDPVHASLDPALKAAREALGWGGQ